MIFLGQAETKMVSIMGIKDTDFFHKSIKTNQRFYELGILCIGLK